ncbi:MAG: radical SAM protein [Chloroflexota bacterium]|nr:radical SAM protein [Chloroflexota bacterium]
MALRELHLLLTYQCTLECDHCFVWGSPFQTGTMTLGQIRHLLAQAEELGSIRAICFEGGEPFMYYATLLQAVRDVKARGWQPQLVTNAYWATSREDALLALRPLVEAGLDAMWVSDDAYHSSADEPSPPRFAAEAASQLSISPSTIAIEPPSVVESTSPEGKGEPIVGGGVRFRGRAVAKLLESLPRRPWQELTSCPYEDLTDPKRVHIDPLGYVHLCQGITIGNTWAKPLLDITQSYVASAHPIVGPLLAGGPAALAAAFGVTPDGSYVDECHLCYDLRDRLRRRLPQWLAPDQMYGVPES